MFGLETFLAAAAVGLFQRVFAGSQRDEGLDRANVLFEERLQKNEATRAKTAADYDEILRQQRVRDTQAELNAGAENYQESAYNKYLKNEAINATANQQKDLGLYNSASGIQSIADTGAAAAQRGMDEWLNRLIAGEQNKFNNQLAALAGRANVEAQGEAERYNESSAMYGTQTQATEDTYRTQTQKGSTTDVIASKSIDALADQAKRNSDTDFLKEHSTTSGDLLKKAPSSTPNTADTETLHTYQGATTSTHIDKL